MTNIIKKKILNSLKHNILLYSVLEFQILEPYSNIGLTSQQRVFWGDTNLNSADKCFTKSKCILGLNVWQKTNPRLVTDLSIDNKIDPFIVYLYTTGHIRYIKAIKLHLALLNYNTSLSTQKTILFNSFQRTW